MGRPGPLLASCGVVLGALALTEGFWLMPAAVTAYVGAWWALGLEHDDAPRSGIRDDRST